MYLLTGSKRTEFYQNINQFTMMPSYSAADLRFPQKNLYMKWDNQYLCGKTPFDFIYAPPANEQHVTVSAEGSQYFENEIKCAIPNLPVFIRNEIVGASNFCNSSTYTIESCKPIAPTSISWTATPSGIVSIVNNGNSALITKLSSGVVTLNATSASSCGNNFNISKQITVGPPLPISNIQTAYTMFKCNVIKYIFTVIGAQGATNYKWYYRNVTQGTPFELFKNSSANFANSPVNDGSCDQIEIRIDATNECSVTPEQYFFLSDLCPPFTDGSCRSGRMLTASPNPSVSSVQLQLIDEPNVIPVNAQPKKILKIRIVDKIGQIKKVINGNQLDKMIIDLYGLQTDIYTILVFDGKEWMSKQINKN